MFDGDIEVAVRVVRPADAATENPNLSNLGGARGPVAQDCDLRLIPVAKSPVSQPSWLQNRTAGQLLRHGTDRGRTDPANRPRHRTGQSNDLGL